MIYCTYLADDRVDGIQRKVEHARQLPDCERIVKREVLRTVGTAKASQHQGYIKDGPLRSNCYNQNYTCHLKFKAIKHASSYSEYVSAHCLRLNLLQQHLLNVLLIEHLIPDAKAPNVASTIAPIPSLQSFRGGHDSFSGVLWGANEGLTVVHLQHAPEMFADWTLPRVKCVVGHMRHLKEHCAAAHKPKTIGLAINNNARCGLHHQKSDLCFETNSNPTTYML